MTTTVPRFIDNRLDNSTSLGCIIITILPKSHCGWCGHCSRKWNIGTPWIIIVGRTKSFSPIMQLVKIVNIRIFEQTSTKYVGYFLANGRLVVSIALVVNVVFVAVAFGDITAIDNIFCFVIAVVLAIIRNC
jgi:hypothetical protein